MTNQKFSTYLEPEEVRTIINAIPQVSKHPERDQLLIELIWQSGARVTEAITLTPERIGSTSIVLRNLKQYKKVKVSGRSRRTHDKTATKEVEVSNALCQRLKSYCDKNKIEEGEYVFKGRIKNNHLSRFYVWKMLGIVSEYVRVYRFGKKNPRTGGRFKGAYPHALRHSNAMFLLEQIGDISIVKEQLGHALITTTQGYAFAKKPRIKKEVAKIEW